MANVFDVAAYILERKGPMTTWKLQKLVYYAQAWSLVWDEDELFPEECRAWANGPVVKELFDAHRGLFRIEELEVGDPSALTSDQTDSVDAVLEYYADRTPRWLRELTHLEDPWKDARGDLQDEQKSDAIISKPAMANYYTKVYEQLES